MHNLTEKAVLDRKTDDVTSGRTDPAHGCFKRFRGEWVKARGEIRKKCPWDVGLPKIEITIGFVGLSENVGWDYGIGGRIGTPI